MKFSICIPTLNEEKYIGGILGCLTKQAHKDFEVIVCDGKSKDKTKQAVLKFSKKLDIKFIEAPKKGVSFQRNYAAKHAKGASIIFFDADVMIDKDFLEKINKYVETHNVDVLTSWNKPLSKRLDDDLIYFIHNVILLESIKKINPGAVGVFIFVKKKAFDAVKGFREDVYFGEDYDLVKRLHKKGFKYALLRKPPIRVSMRRMDKEGRLGMIRKEIKAVSYYLASGGDYERIQGKVKHESGKF